MDTDCNKSRSGWVTSQGGAQNSAVYILHNSSVYILHNSAVYFL